MSENHNSNQNNNQKAIESAETKETIGGRFLEAALDGLNYAYRKVAQRGLRMFSALGLSYILCANVIAKYILNDMFLIASWMSIVIFYIMVVVLAAVIYIVFDVIKDLLIYVLR